jgi:hypothetical protein
LRRTWDNHAQITGLLVFVDRGSIFQCFVGACIACTFLVVQTWHRPYVEYMDNLLKVSVQTRVGFNHIQALHIVCSVARTVLCRTCLHESLVCNWRTIKSEEAKLDCRWQVVAEAQLFMTLLLTIILRFSADQLDADTLSEDQCGIRLRKSSSSAACHDCVQSADCASVRAGTARCSSSSFSPRPRSPRSSPHARFSIS